MCFKHEKVILSPSVGSDSATLTLQKMEAAFVTCEIREVSFSAVFTSGYSVGLGLLVASLDFIGFDFGWRRSVQMGCSGADFCGQIFISRLWKGLTRRKKYNFRSNNCQFNIYM